MKITGLDLDAVHVMAGRPGFLILEYGWGEVPWRSDPVGRGREVGCDLMGAFGGVA